MLAKRQSLNALHCDAGCSRGRRSCRVRIEPHRGNSDVRKAFKAHSLWESKTKMSLRSKTGPLAFPVRRRVPGMPGRERKSEKHRAAATASLPSSKRFDPKELVVVVLSVVVVVMRLVVVVLVTGLPFASHSMILISLVDGRSLSVLVSRSLRTCPASKWHNQAEALGCCSSPFGWCCLRILHHQSEAPGLSCP